MKKEYQTGVKCCPYCGHEHIPERSTKGYDNEECSECSTSDQYTACNSKSSTYDLDPIVSFNTDEQVSYVHNVYNRLHLDKVKDFISKNRGFHSVTINWG